MRVLVGSYADRTSTGMYVYWLNAETGELLLIETVSGIDNPSFLAISDGQQHVYAVSESAHSVGAVSAYSLHPESHALTYQNQQSTEGEAPCHLTVTRSGKHLLAVNYSGGNVCVYPLHADGSIGAMSDQVHHYGCSIHPSRQTGPHPHSVFLDPAERFALVPDLGLDRIMIYELDTATGTLCVHDEVAVSPGAGPRHLVFHPSGHYVYVINELASTITVFHYDALLGRLQSVQTVPTLPEGYTGESTCADIHTSPDGRFLYGSNRGHDSIVVYGIEEADGTLSYVEHVLTEGKTPRNFAITPDGAFLLAANQDSDCLVTFRLDRQSGRISTTGKVTQVAKPVCVKVLSDAVRG